MTVETDLDRAQYATNATTGPWTVPFYFLADDELSVTYTDASGFDTPLTLDVDYTVAGAGDAAGGTITTTQAYASGGKLVILRDVNIIQPIEYQDGDGFPAKTHEMGLDRLTMIAQQLREQFGRAVTFPPSYDGGTNVLPSAAGRANQLFGFDSAGNPIAVAPTSGSAADLALSLQSSVDATKASGQIKFNFQLNYAVGTIGWAVKNALGANPLWFGAKGDGVRDDTIEVQAAMNFSKTTSFPGGFIFLCKSGLFLNQAQQVLLGDGLSSEIRFALTTPGVGLATSNATGQQQILGVFLNGVSNVTKTVSVGSPQLTMANGYVYNATATGHCVYQEDENTGAGTYVFALSLLNMILRGPGPGATLPAWTNLNTYGLRLGTNSQGTRVIGGAITNCSTLIWINGATTQLTIQGPILQNCADTEQAIHIDRPGSGMPCYEISITAYFEQAHRCIVNGDADSSNLTIRGCIANRNTLSSQATSYFYLAPGGTSANTQNISIDENHHGGYGSFLGLGNEYGSRITSCRGNTTDPSNPTTSFSSGTFANNAYEIRTVTASYGYLVEAGGTTINAGGAVVSVSNQRIELKNGTISVPLPVTTRDSIAKIDFYAIPQGGNTLTVNLVESPVTNVGGQTTIGTVATSAAGVAALSVANGYAVKDGYSYILQAAANNVGTTSYLYAFKVYLYR